MDYEHKYLKYKSKYLELQKQMLPQDGSGARMSIVSLNVYKKQKNKFQNTNMHITIFSYDKSKLKVPYKTFCDDIVNKYKSYLGRNNVYKLKFDKQWGKNSILTKSWNNKIYINTLRTNIINYVFKKYGNIIDTSLYNSGLPPQHINTYGDMSIVGKTWDVSYKLSC
jgi:hypothetical protein